MTTKTALQEKRLATTSPADVPIDKLPIVELTDEQIDEAKSLALRRAKSYYGYDVAESYGDLSCTDAHLVGVVGELALAELYGANFDDRCHNRGDQGFDFRFGSHLVDVKTTRTRALTRPDLLVPPHPEPSADIYLLAHWFAENKVRVIGYSTRSNVIKREPREYPASKLNHIVPADDLLLPPRPIGIGDSNL